jgi:hypothetical protein
MFLFVFNIHIGKPNKGKGGLNGDCAHRADILGITQTLIMNTL